MPDLLRLVGALRYGGAHYEAKASDSPHRQREPLWPDDSLTRRRRDVPRRRQCVTPDRVLVAARVDQPRLPRAAHDRPRHARADRLRLRSGGAGRRRPGRHVGTTADAAAVSTGRRRRAGRAGDEPAVRGLDPVSPRRLADGAVVLRQQHPRQHPEAGADPAAGRRRARSSAGRPITSQTANGAVFVPAATPPVLVRANFDNARIWGIEHVAEASFTPTVSLRTRVHLSPRDGHRDRPAAEHRRRHAGAATLWLSARYTRPDRRWWVRAVRALRAGSSRTCRTLDLGDRRTGAGRSRASIQAFFLNGARARGWVNAGADDILGTADDMLIATGETLAQIQDRVLGVGVNSSSLFTAVPGYGTFGVRAGASFGSARGDRRRREPERRELPRHQLGHRRARAWRLGEVRGAVLNVLSLQVRFKSIAVRHVAEDSTLVASGFSRNGLIAHPISVSAAARRSSCASPSAPAAADVRRARS